MENIIAAQPWRLLMLEIQIYSLSDDVYTHEESIKEGILKEAYYTTIMNEYKSTLSTLE